MKRAEIRPASPQAICIVVIDGVRYLWIRDNLRAYFARQGK